VALPYFSPSCLLLFAAGEEISWGQRLFEIGTPPELASINSQGELNVHDVVEAQGKFNLALAAISLLRVGCAVGRPATVSADHSRRPELRLARRFHVHRPAGSRLAALLFSGALRLGVSGRRCVELRSSSPSCAPLPTTFVAVTVG
jgi:hypothetical protein